MRVYISSTYSDLKEYRQQARDALLRLGHFPVMAENWSDSETYPVQQCLDLISGCEATVLILGHRYGFIPEGSSISLTQMEYDRATQMGIKVFSFILSDDALVRPSSIETDPANRQKLDNFKRQIRMNSIAGIFGTPQDLRSQVIMALSQLTNIRQPPSEELSDFQSKLEDCQKEQQSYLETIENLRTRMIHFVPAEPVWRGRDFQVDRLLCFVLIPFRDEFFEIYEQAIQPAVQEAGLSALHAGEIFGNREVMEDVWASICKAQVIIADVSSRNPNVFYELGICHTLGKECIVLTQDHNDVPFDIRHRRYIPYSPQKLTSLKNKVTATIKHVLTFQPQGKPEILDS
jgi:hypothetical protein